jgi:DNA-binding LytR/AlgR family response regulator
MTFIAIDDEPLALVVIKKYAETLTDWQLLSSFNDATLAREYIKSNEVDLVISDINMPDINGLQFVKELGEEKPLIIFITAYKEHALEGYDLDVIDYVMKPVSQERFIKAMNKAAEIIKLKSNLNYTQVTSATKDHFYVFSEYEKIKININDILYIEGMGDYIKIYLFSQTKPIITLERMKNIMDNLYSHRFVRIHRSYIINLDRVQSKQKSKIKINDLWLPIGDKYQDVIN